MDYQKAIESLRLEGGIEITGNPRRAAEFFEGLDIAISAMQELQEYHKTGLSFKQVADTIFELGATKRVLGHYQQLGTLEEVREAVEKQRKVKPKDGEYCPICHTFLKDEDDVPGFYCMNCGKAIDWSEEE